MKLKIWQKSEAIWNSRIFDAMGSWGRESGVGSWESRVRVGSRESGVGGESRESGVGGGSRELGVGSREFGSFLFFFGY
jgi:hypothetical protein